MARVVVLLGTWAWSACTLHFDPNSLPPPPDGDTGQANADAIDGPQDTRGLDAPDVHPPNTDAHDALTCVDGTSCGTSCYETLSDPKHCGGCNNDCTMLPNVSPNITCIAGACVLTSACENGFAHCSGPVSGGCETAVSMSPNCGACGVVCSAAAPYCTRGAGDAGGYTCSTGCSGGTPTLCGAGCTDTTSDPHNCGGCGTACGALPHSLPTCVSGVCSYSCISGYHDCQVACALDTSVATCGTSSTSCVPCPTARNGAATCDGMSCGTDCDSGFHLCNGTCVGNTSTNTCGDLCLPCPTVANATSTCDGTSCGFTCSSGYQSCGGACTPVTSITACGSSCATCVSAPHSMPTCPSGACVNQCDTGYADCDGNAANGCETNLGAAATCGSCNTACSGGTPLCEANGAGGFLCKSSCTASETLCGTTCTNTNTDTSNCGSCGTVCTPPDNGTATCVGGLCGSQCSAGFHPCGSVCATNASTDTCGTACSACPAPANAMPTCDGTSCGFTCNGGYHLCGSTCVSNLSTASCGPTACGACTQPANAVATCDGTACGFTCSAGFHLCGNACVSNASTGSCGGGNCSPCQPPSNATATCDGTSCGFTCSSGFHQCAGTCVTNTSPNTCGTSACTPCQPPANAGATCDGTTCGFTCNAGFHQCAGACVPNTSVTSCGSTSCTDCSPPANSVATCDGANCGFSCNTGFAACTPGSCTDLSANMNCGHCGTQCVGSTSVCEIVGGSFACATVCPTGQTNCSSSCTATQTDPANCGACNVGCPVPANGSATCAAGVCGIACSPGYHLCNGNCVSNASVSSCGSTSCMACPTPGNATATCDGTNCGISCNGGYHLCGGSCVSNSSTTSCGSSCDACPIAPNGSATCDGSSCGVQCSPGYEQCSPGSCVSSTSIANCGPSCTTCPSPPNASPTCDGTSCGVACNPGFVLAGGSCVSIAAPQPIGPLSTSVTTVTRPKLSWVLGTGAGAPTGAHVQICADRACQSTLQTIDVTGSGALPGANLPPGVYYWQLFGEIGSNLGTTPGPTWQFTVPVVNPSAAVDAPWGTTLDANGDGYADVLVGGPGSNAAYVFFGSMSGTTDAVATTLTASGAADFGDAVASAGDVNGDGFSDAIVGAPGSNTAYLFLGNAAGLSSVATTTLTGSGGFGTSVSFAGDVNRDGYGDVIVGAPASSTAYVYFGSASGLSTTPNVTLNGASSGTFGASVAGAGDVDGNGAGDVIVGDPLTGAAYVYLGNAGIGTAMTAASTLMGPISFGTAVSAAGDVNDDGYTDVIVGAPESGQADVYLGGVSGLNPNPIAVSINGGSGSGSGLGAAVACLGDANGDGYDDVLVSSTNANAAWVFLGSAAGTAMTAWATLTPPTNMVSFGTSAVGAGDVNADGYFDLLVGDPGASNATVYFGLPSGPMLDTTLNGSASSIFGQSVALDDRAIDRSTTAWHVTFGSNVHTSMGRIVGPGALAAILAR